MGMIVQKYGGTSVANPERIRAVAGRIARSRGEANRVVAVVSAMGDTTDDLIELAHQLDPEPEERALDLLLSTGEIQSCALVSMALHAGGAEAIALTGPQAGIRTDRRHFGARILAIEPDRIVRELDRGRIVIVAGFQGATEEMDITTLGRGASDLTAVALAAALKADLCELYKDVDGVMTADPRLAPNARLLDEIDYEEMLEMAQQGARVLAPRAVELAEVYRVPIVVRSSFNEGPGTLIHEGVTMELRNKVRAIAHDTDLAKVTVQGVADRPGISAALFEPLAEAGVSVDVIVQNASSHNVTDLSFTVTRGDLARTVRIVEPVAQQIGAQQVLSSEGWAKVSVVGTGMQNAPGYAARMFRALADKKINIEMITTSEIRITCIVEQGRLAEAVAALHEAFRLDRAEL